MNVNSAQLISLQSHTESIRNICILAHVDHGKTTLSDHLIGSNGLIHPRLMGEMRYMDSRDDEQARGITMKSSSIALLYRPRASQNGSASGNVSAKEDILVNLIDSPGHVDFCSEVSTAARLSDGALVIIDCVEGVCIQTHAVLRQAWEEQVRLTLVLNKIDRLILEVKLTPEQAYERMKAIITQVNMIVSTFQSEQDISEVDVILASQDVSAQAEARDSEGEDAVDEQEFDFSPEKGNVAFASAHDGWAFQIRQFANLYAEKMGVKAEKLEPIMWGDWTYDSKSKRAVKLKKGSKAKPLFVQLILGPLWKAYEAAEPGADVSTILSKIIAGLKLKVNERSLSYQEPRKALRQVLQNWLPLADAILGMVVDQLPDPITAMGSRHKRLLPTLFESSEADKGLLQSLENIQKAVASCSSCADSPTMVYVSKMIAVPASLLPRETGQSLSVDPKSDVFLAFGRVFSGQIKDGDTVHVLSSAYNPLTPDKDSQELQVKGLYLMMGRGLEKLEKAQAGSVVAIGGLETAILKSATLSSTKSASPIAPMLFQASAIVRVAIEPVNPTQMPQLEDGLRLLNRADPFVEVSLQESGEHVIGAAGEVHLEMCIKDLKERFAKIDFHVSPPLVAFRESCFYPAEFPDTPPKPPKVVEGHTANGMCTIRVRANPLPRQLASLLEENEPLIFRSLASNAKQKSSHHQTNGHLPAAESESAESLSPKTGKSEQTMFQSKVKDASQDLRPEARALLSRSWIMGPHRAGPNLLTSSLASTKGKDTSSLFDVPSTQIVSLAKRPGASNEDEPTSEDRSEATNTEGAFISIGNSEAASVLGLARESSSSDSSQGNGTQNGGQSLSRDQEGDEGQASYLRRSLEAGLNAGFQLATANGPLCGEPMWGLIFEVEVRLQAQSSSGLGEEIYGPISGQVTSVASQLFRKALMEADPRLVEAMFFCEVSTSAEALSGTYAVLGQRRARILREELREGSGLFSIHAFLPAEASFGFADDMRRKSSGAASASLLLSHWERLQVDPFFIPLTEEEREEFGEEGQGVGAPNLANSLIDKVRIRKGLPVGKKVVKSSTKQRTRARKV